jgi:aerobic carbon-monoxide dehydrogenase medium subunit
MYAFDYRRPMTIAEAERALAAMDGAKLLAGGQTLIPAMKFRLNRPGAIVDLTGIPGLNEISREGESLIVGAMTTHAEIATSAAVISHIPGLARLAEGIGDPQVRNRGTIGGSLANNDPAADYPAAVVALDATVQTNTRSIGSREFFHGLFTTALGDGEIVTEIAFPIPKRFAYAKFPNPASRFALAGVAVAVIGSGVRVAVTGAGAGGVFRASAMEAALSKSFTPDALDGIAVEESRLVSDLHADSEYRAHLIGVMAKRAVQAAMG